MHPQLTQFRRVEPSVFNHSLGARLLRSNGSFSGSHTGSGPASVARAVDPVAISGLAQGVHLATIVAGVQSVLRANTGTLMAGGASAPPNYVFNRTVGDRLRSNQTISALGRLTRR